MNKQVEIINIKQEKAKRLIDIISTAGFNTKFITVCERTYIRLEDKNNTNADEYSDLTFRTLIEAVKAIQPYIINSFKLVA